MNSNTVFLVCHTKQVSVTRAKTRRRINMNVSYNAPQNSYFIQTTKSQPSKFRVACLLQLYVILNYPLFEHETCFFPSSEITGRLLPGMWLSMLPYFSHSLHFFYPGLFLFWEVLIPLPGYGPT